MGWGVGVTYTPFLVKYPKLKEDALSIHGEENQPLCY